MHDVVVIGAGPAGSFTSQRLANRGHRVVLLEEHEAIGAPVHCTGLLGADAFDEFDLPRSLVLAETGTARFWSAGGRSVPLQSDRVNAVVIDRAALDQHLGDRAVAAGVELRLNTRAETVSVTSRGVMVTTKTGECITARAAVLACGAQYRFHRALGLGLPSVVLQSAQVETPFPCGPDIEVRLGRDVAPGGFAWMVPLRRDGRDVARIGLMTDEGSAPRFETFLRSLAGRAGVDPATVPAPRFKMLPLGPVERSFGDRVVAVGDAAGLVKPTTGGGIYYGLVSGALAAGVLDESLAADRLDARSLARYERQWRRRLGQEIRVGLAFRRIATRLNDESIDQLIDLAGQSDVAPIIKSAASFNWHRKAAIALLGHPSVRRVVFRSWARSASSI